MAFPLRGTPIIQAFNPPGLSVDPAGDIEAIGFDVTASGNALLVSMAGAPVVVAVDLDLADDEVAIGGPDSGGTRRLFEGRDTGGGNNIIESVPVLLGAQALTLGKAEDTSHISGDVGVAALSVRRDVPGSMVDVEDDYAPLQTDANGQLRVGGAAPTGLGKSEDAVHADGDVGVMALAVRNDAGTPLAADGDYIPLMADANGNLFTTVRGISPGTPQVIRSDKDTDFTGALAQDASADANLSGLNGDTGRIRSVTVLSDQQLAWEIAFYSADTFRSADADADAYIDSVRLSEGDGLQDDGTGLFRYAVTGLDIPYVDDDASNELHVSLINRSATAKNAGATGEIVVRVGIEESE